MSTGQPAPAENPARERAEREADERLDELEDAEPERPAQDDSPFDGTDEVQVDLADIDVGEPVGESSGDMDEVPPEEDAHADPFDGTEDAAGFDDVGADPFAPDDSAVEDMADEASEPFIESVLNEGAARTAVVGLPDEFEVNGETRTKQDLQDEFEEVFETFRLGQYGSEVFEEYLAIEDDDIDPIWGFTASVFLCTAMVLWMRPDGTEMFNRTVEKLKSRSA